MKWFTIGLIILASNSLYSLDLDSSSQRAVDKFSEDLAEAVAEFEEAKQEAYERLERSLGRERSSAERRGEQGVVDLIDETLAQAQEQMETAGQLTDFVGEPVAVESVNPRQADRIARNLDKLTPEQWEAAPGVEVPVSAARRNDTGIVARPDERYLIIPHPTDLWLGDNRPNPAGGVMGTQVDWRGLAEGESNPQRHMIMAWCVGEWADGKLTYVFSEPIVSTESEGALMLGCQDHGLFDNEGAIRVKIIRVE